VTKSGYEYHIPAMYEYVGASTTEGDCGSPLFLNVRHQSPIAGIHSLASTKGQKGCAMPIFRDDIENRLKFLMTTEYGAMMPGENTVQDEQWTEQGLDIDEMFTVIKQVPNYAVTRKTKLRRTPLYEKYGESTRKPAVLTVVERDGNVIDPLVRNLLGRPDQIIPLESDTIFMLARHLILHEKPNLDDPWFRQPKYLRKLTYEEAVAGIEGMREWHGLDRSTCAGIPWMYDTHGKGGKRYWMGMEGDYDFKSPGALELRKRVEEYDSMIRKGIRPPTTTAIFLKDELRSHKKIDAVSTRTICADDVAITILFRQYFGAYAIMNAKCNVKNHCATGMNPYSNDWHRMKRTLDSVGGPPICGDYVQFDNTIMALWMMAVGYAINVKYDGDEGDTRARCTLIEDCAFPNIAVPALTIPPPLKDLINVKERNGQKLTMEELTLVELSKGKMAKVIRQTLGLGSGKWPTAVFGSKVGELVNLNGFRVICKIPAADAHAVWEENVRLVVSSDDNIFTVSEQYRDKFQALSYSEYVKTVGMRYTKADKTEYTTTHDTWETASFLKRGFKEIEGSVVAPLDLETIREMTYWTRVDDNWRTCRDTFDAAIGELSLHGKDVFDKMYPPMRAAYIEAFKVQPKRYTWRENYNYIRQEVNLIGI
jgi:hypothetical protein